MAEAEVIPTGRVEAFSDGVIAVAITLLVLDLTVPEPDGTGALGLGQRLLEEWPSYVAYVISFLSIGIMWINHHTMLRRVVGVDHAAVILNLFLLLFIVLLPFTTSLLSRYLDEPEGGHLAAVVYAASLLATSSLFLAMQRHLLVKRPHLLRHALTAAQVRRVLIRAGIAPPVYLVAGGLGLISPYLTLAVCILLGVFYFLAPPMTGRAAGE